MYIHNAFTEAGCECIHNAFTEAGCECIHSLHGGWVCVTRLHLTYGVTGCLWLRDLPRCAELEANIFAEGVSAGMGQESKKGTTTLNRRGGSASASWAPLLWAAKDNNLVVAEMLIDKGHDVNKQEALSNKGLSGYAALHWAAHKGHLQMCELLLSRGANPVMNDKHNNTAQQLAEKKGEKEIVALLESYISGTPTTGGGKQAANKGANKGKAATKGKAPAKQADAGGVPSLLEKPEGLPSLFADADDPMLES